MNKLFGKKVIIKDGFWKGLEGVVIGIANNTKEYLIMFYQPEPGYFKKEDLEVEE